MKIWDSVYISPNFQMKLSRGMSDHHSRYSPKFDREPLPVADACQTKKLTTTKYTASCTGDRGSPGLESRFMLL